MDRAQALELLGLADDADAAAIASALRSRRQSLQAQRDSAPTPALQEKFKTLLQRLDQAEQLLSPASPRSSLSKTKLADLPQAAPAGTGFDTGNASAQLDLAPGAVLAGRYEILEQIGAGGMGAVFHARDRTREEDVALKVLLPGLVSSERARQRFLDEARLSSKLSHPGIVNVFDVQQDGDYVFLSMELLEGQDLRRLMENRQLTRQAFSEEEARSLASSLAEALHYAHQHTVHRDIKPENIWVDEAGRYKVMDFGIARVMSSSQRTQTGVAMGTAYYMAPEQLKGTGQVDARADQYALGVLLYEVLTGDVPAGRIKPLRQLRPDLGKGFAAAVDRSLEPAPEDRFEDMLAFSQALSGKGGGLPAFSFGPRARLAAIVFVVLAALGGGIASGSFSKLWQAWQPVSEEELRARYSRALQLQGAAVEQEQRIERAFKERDDGLRDLRRDISQLEARIRDGMGNVAANRGALAERQRRLTELEREYDVLRRFVFESSERTELSGEMRAADGLIRDNSYLDAIALLERVINRYQQLRDRLDNVTALLAAEDAATGIRNDWQQFASRQSIGSNPAVNAVDALWDKASDLHQRGAFGEAVVVYGEAGQAYRELQARAADSVSARNEALASRNTWRRYAQAEQLLQIELAQQVEADFQAIEQAHSNGDYAQAADDFGAIRLRFIELHEGSRNASRNSERAAAARSAWESYRRDSGMIFPEQLDSELLGNYDRAQQAMDANQLPTAGVIFGQVATGYQGLLERVRATMQRMAQISDNLRRACRGLNLSASGGWQAACEGSGAYLQRSAANRQHYATLSELLLPLERDADEWGRLTSNYENLQRRHSELNGQLADIARYQSPLGSLAALLDAVPKAAAGGEQAPVRSALQRADTSLAELEASGSKTLLALRSKPEMLSVSMGGASFALAAKPVTVADYQRFVTATGYRTRAERPDSEGCWGFDRGRWGYSRRFNWQATGFAQTADHPVVCVSYEDAKAYINWLNEEISGVAFRLPTEREWLLAARAGTSSKYYWGERMVPGKVNCRGCGRPDTSVRTMPVASFDANPLGFYDMLGNVWEITDSCWGADGQASRSACENIVLKGGGWSSDPESVVPEARIQSRRDSQIKGDIGFRIASDK